MRIGLLSPSIYMSPERFGDMIFAPRELSIALADGLVAKGHEVYFFTAPDVVTRAHLIGGDKELLESNLIEGKLAHAGGERMKWASHYTVKRSYELDLTQKCYRMAQEGKFDIIHSYHDTIAHYFDELTAFSTLYTLHDPVPTDTKTVFHWLLSKFRSHRYVAISEAHRRNDSIGLNFIDTVYHGISLPTDTGKSPGSYLAFVGRMVPEKGAHIALDVARRSKLPIKIATSPMKINQETDYFNGIVKPYTRDVSVEFTEFLKGDEKNLFFSRARALVFPILWEEPFGMVMIEAMAAGTPVIAYNRGSVSEIVRDGVTGFIIDPDLPNLPDHPDWVIKKRGIDGLVEAVRRIGEIDRAACRRHVEEHFTVAKMVEGYEKVYQKILGE